MVPERLAIIRPIHFLDPWGSKVTPWVPKVAPGVPKVTPQAPPRPQKGPLLDAQSDSGDPLATQFRILFAPLVCDSAFCCPLAPSTHQPIDTSTQQPIDTTSLQERAGGMRGAIE